MTDVEIEAVIADVESVSARTTPHRPPWDDPHTRREVADEEYSRLTDPGKWRIVNARTDAWIDVLVSAGRATVRRGVAVTWTHGPAPTGSSVDVVSPFAAGALELVISRSRIGGLDDVGVVLGVRTTVGHDTPTVEIGLVPDCGCDACDSGSQNAIDQLDEHVMAVVEGTLRLLVRGRQEIRILDGVVRGARNIDRRVRIERVLADPRGWHVYEGSSWLTGVPEGPQQ